MKPILLSLLLTASLQAAPISLDLNPPNQRQYRAKVPDGHYGVRAHGFETIILDGVGRAMDERALVAWIKRDPRYREGQPVYLLACHTGKPRRFGRNFAQRLADLLRAPVTAPTTKVWVYPDGSHRALGGRNEPDEAQKGQMLTFLPKLGSKSTQS